MGAAFFFFFLKIIINIVAICQELGLDPTNEKERGKARLKLKERVKTAWRQKEQGKGPEGLWGQMANKRRKMGLLENLSCLQES